jgi:protein O-mannosyl-transferase
MSKKKKKKSRPAGEESQHEKPQMRHSEKKVSKHGLKWIAALLGITFICLFPVLGNDFINFDDPQYVLENPVIKDLGKENINLMFTKPILGNYQPFVLLSYAIQYKMFELEAGGYHFFSLLFHLINTFLVFLVAFRILKNRTGAFITALLFGIHPLHVESVAWVAAQKDILYACFFLLSMKLYLDYKEKPEGGSKRLYILSLLCFTVSLFSKAQAVVLPVLLMLIDYLRGRQLFGRNFMEKVPYFILSVVVGLLAIAKQKEAGAIQDFEYFSLGERILFASYGFMKYLWQSILPVKLSIFYPYPETNGKINSSLVYLGIVVAAAVTLLVFLFGRKNRIVLFGYLFFCVNIALVIQLIPVGDAIHADRYSYVSLLGLFFIAGHFLGDQIENRKSKLAIGICVLYGAFLGVLTFQYSTKWADSITIYSHGLNNYPAPIIYANRGAEYFKIGEYQKSIEDFSGAIAIKPQFPHAYKNRGLTYEKLQKYKEALDDLEKAAIYRPDDLAIFITRGNILKATGNYAAAITDYTTLLKLNPGVLDAYLSRAECFWNLKRYNEALADLDQLLTLKNDSGDAWFNRSITLLSMGRFKEAYDSALNAKKFGKPVDDAFLNDLKAKAQ